MGKAVNVAGISLAGVDALNYSFNATAATTANITQLASVAYTGASGQWSVAANWAGGALPDGANVAAVTIPVGVTVSYDLLAGSTTLNTLSGLGNFTMNGGTLNVSGLFDTAQYVQVAGALTAGGVNVTNAFNQSGGTLTSAGGVTLNGTIVQAAPAGITAASLSASAAGGITLNGANRISTVAAMLNTVAGNISLFNTAAPLTLNTVTNGAGNVLVDNIGGIVVNGVMHSSGTFDLIAHSPITVNAGGAITAGGAVTLTAGVAGSVVAADIITLNGPVGGSSVTLAANKVVGTIPAGATLLTAAPPIVLPVIAPATIPVAVAPIVSAMLTAPVAFTPPTPAVLLQEAAPSTAADPNNPDKKTDPGLVAAGNPAPIGEVAPAAPLPVCH